MKRRYLIFIISLVMYACSKDSEQAPLAPIDNLVSKIYDGDDQLVAQFFYDDEKLLVRREFTNTTTGYTSQLRIVYKSGLVDSIIVKGTDISDFRYERKYAYNDQGILEGIQSFDGQVELSNLKVQYDSLDRLITLATVDSLPNRTIQYNSDGNASKMVTVLNKDNLDRSEEFFEQVYEFTYDTFKKPNFGIQQFIDFELVPFFYNLDGYSGSVSKNNIIEQRLAGETYLETYDYEYNEAGYPISIVQRNQSGQTLTLKLEYR